MASAMACLYAISFIFSLPIAFGVLGQFDAEIVEGKFIERDALAEILEV